MTATTPPPRRVLVIANPISGGGRSRELVPALCAALGAAGIAAEAHFTTRAGDATARARTAGAEGYDALIAAGGDGTIHEVLNGMPDPSMPLGFLPVGTANVLAVELALPREPQALAALVARGALRPHPVGESNGRRFLLFVGAGLDGAVVERLSQVRTGTLGKHKWLGPILHTARHWPRFALTAEFADGERLDGLASVLVTRVRNFGGVVALTPDIDPREAVLHVLCFRGQGRARWLWQGLRALARRLRPGPNLVVRRTRALRITGDAPFQIDGEFGGRTPLDLRLLDAPARLFAP